jgi:hypothetical protein
MIIVLIIIITLLVLFLLFLLINKKNEDKHIANNSDYLDMKYIFDNRKIIQEEFFNNIIKSENWTNWMEYDKVSNTPIFTKMSRDEILNRMFQNKCSLDNGKPSWKLFGLFLYGQPINENIKLCSNTIEMLKNCNGIINAGFSCLEPGVITALHRDFNKKVLRCHIPIYIPQGDTAIKINNEIKYWNDNEYFIFDDTYDHQAWNYTKEKRIVLIIDILKL